MVASTVAVIIEPSKDRDSMTMRQQETNNVNQHSNEELIEPNAENHYNVARSDLPLSCPMPGMKLWNSHPRVYLPVEEEGTSACPYCGASYTLLND